MINVDIFGSCVTRDCFPLLEGEFNVGTYIARHSLVSASSSPIQLPCQAEDIRANSNFERRMVIRDLQKTAFDDFSKSGSDYLIIDFIDERFDLCLLPHGQIFTRSNELLTSGLFSDAAICHYDVDSRKSIIAGKSIEDHFRLFSEKLLGGVFPSKRIILHEAYLVDWYIDRQTNAIKPFDKNKINLNAKQNKKLEILYGLAREYIPNLAGIIGYSRDYCADSDHKWGLATCHYQPEYYRRASDDIARICRGFLPPTCSLLSHEEPQPSTERRFHNALTKMRRRVSG